MQYEVLRLNDNNTATVIMTASTGQTLQQDFELGDNVDDLETNVKAGMRIFKRDIEAVVPDTDVSSFEEIIGTPIEVTLE